MPINVLVVDDSSFFRRQITKLLSDDDSLNVIDTAENGKDAVEKALRLNPDVITMDIEMPIMDGISATREILRHKQIPILMFSTLTTDGAKVTLDAMDAGAVDFIPKSFQDISRNKADVKRILCQKIHDIGAHGRTRILNAKLNARSASQKVHNSLHDSAQKTVAETPRTSQLKLLAIGTSTGGPLALQEVLKDLPQDFPLPIVLVQHMPSTFTPAFANRLNQLCNIAVKEASDGDHLEPGHAYLAPGGMQMTVKKVGSHFQLKVFEGNEALTYKPSVDVTFESIADTVPGDALAIILTGMGADGCKGAKKMQQGGSHIWAQDEASSVVWGMPAAVVDAGITEKILALNNICPQILRAV